MLPDQRGGGLLVVDRQRDDPDADVGPRLDGPLECPQPFSFTGDGAVPGGTVWSIRVPLALGSYR